MWNIVDIYICCAFFGLDNKASPSFIIYEADSSCAWYGLQNQEVSDLSVQPVLERQIPLALLLEYNTSLISGNTFQLYVKKTECKIFISFKEGYFNLYLRPGIRDRVKLRATKKRSITT
jgi:hypothetical protein